MRQLGIRCLALSILFIGMGFFTSVSLAHTPPMLADINVSFVSADGKQMRPCPNPHFASYCTLTIHPPFSFTGSIQITNQSSTITATNITALIPSSISFAVALMAPTTITLAPGASGILTFQALSLVSPTLIEVKGDNTQSGFFYIFIS